MARSVHSRYILKRFAVSNVTDPLAALERVKNNIEKILTITNIAERLGWSEVKAAGVFTPGLRKEFAVRHILDPLGACHAWAIGRTSLGQDKDASRDNKLAELSE